MNANPTAPAAKENFLAELSASWRALPDRFLFLTLLAAWLALFQFLGNSALGYVKTESLFGWLLHVLWTSLDDQHGLFVPVVVAVLLWDKRVELLALKKENWWPALTLVVAGLLLHIAGFALHQTRISLVGFFTGLYGLTGLVWGRQWLRSSFFPFFLFAFCIPHGTQSDTLTSPLRLLAAKITVLLARIAGVDVLREGTLIFDADHSFSYDVVPACSGIRSLMMVLAVATIFGFVQFRATWQRLLMMASALPLAVAGNVARLTAVIFISELFGQDAGVWLEQKLGLVTFLGSIGCVWLLARWLKKKIAGKETP